jgi:hypothetical protein
MLAPCSDDEWTQQWVLDTTPKGVCLHVPNATGALKCMDNGGSPGKTFPDGPHEIHMWSQGFSDAQDWVCVNHTLLPLSYLSSFLSSLPLLRFLSFWKFEPPFYSTRELVCFGLGLKNAMTTILTFLYFVFVVAFVHRFTRYDAGKKQISDPVKKVCLTSADGKYVVKSSPPPPLDTLDSCCCSCVYCILR